MFFMFIEKQYHTAYSSALFFKHAFYVFSQIFMFKIFC